MELNFCLMYVHIFFIFLFFFIFVILLLCCYLTAIKFVYIKGKTLHQPHLASLVNTLKKMFFYCSKLSPIIQIPTTETTTLSSSTSEGKKKETKSNPHLPLLS